MKSTNYLKAMFLLMGSMVIAQGKSQEKLYNVKIEVHYEMSKPGDTLYLIFSPANMAQFRKTEERYMALVDANGTGHFNVLQQYPYGYISILKNKQLSNTDFLGLAENLFWENGDDISLRIEQPTELSKREYYYDTKFKGTNAYKYEAIYNIRKAYNKVQEKRRENPMRALQIKNKYDYTPVRDDVGREYLLAILDSSKSKISSFSYQVLKTDIMMQDDSFKTRGLYALAVRNTINQATKDSIVHNLKTDFFPIPHFADDQKALAASKNLIGFYTILFYTIGRLQPDYSEMSVVKNIVQNSSGVLRESILTTFLNVAGYSRDKKELYDTIYNHLKDEYYLSMFNHIKSKSEINISQYVLKDTEGNDVSLSKYKGKILLLDFWSTGCSACIAYRNNVLSHIEEEYKNDSGFQIISINMDKDFNRFKKSVALDTYVNPNGHNLYTSGMEMDHPLPRGLGVAMLPTPILIDYDGNVLDNYSYKLRYLPLLREVLHSHLK